LHLNIIFFCFVFCRHSGTVFREAEHGTEDDNEGVIGPKYPDGEVKRLRMELLNEMKSSCSSNTMSTLETEIQRYLSPNIVSPAEDALSFWKANAKKFPVLAAMAKVYLCLSPGSVPVECMFSTTGLILNGKRSCLAPTRCNMISFIHDNYKLLY